MKKIEEKVINFITKQKLIEPGDNILLALSGGPDSVFLLYFLNKYSPKYKIKIGAFHLNHMVRGDDADSDEIFCFDLCAELKIDFFSIKEDVQAYAKKNKVSLEEAGRNIRYSVLKKISTEYGYNKIATAHNSGDNSETVILNLIKGTGLKGLTGIPVKRDNIVRPILPLSKDEILSYLQKKKIPFRLDKSNYSPEYERNFIRLELIPMIKKELNPSIEETLFSSSRILTDINNFLVKLVSDQINNIKKDGLNLRIPLKTVTDFYEELRGLFLKTLIERNFLINITFKDIAVILDLMNNLPGKQASLSSGYNCLRERSSLLISKKISDNIAEDVLLVPGKSVVIGASEVSVKYVTKKSGFSSGRNKEYISGDRFTEDKFLIRRWQPGDRFIPFGMKGSKKVSDFLNSIKMEPSAKKDQLVILYKGKIIWVVGQRIDNRFRITEQTIKVLKLCLKKN